MARHPHNSGSHALWTASAAALALIVGATAPVQAATAAKKLSVTLDGIKNGATIPADYAFCAPSAQGHMKDGANQNPGIKWSKGPAGTQSYAVIVVDRDVPSSFNDGNQEGKTIPAGMKRVDFYHWVLVDIPASKTEIARGADSKAITLKGKAPGKTANGLTGVNDFTAFNASDPKLAGNYGGYDGPCPPWNDARLHHYHFIVYALDVPSLGLTGNFDGKAATAAIAKHTLAKGEVVGSFTLNPAVMAKAKRP